MTTGRIGQGGSPGAALYHVENIAPRHGIGGELVALAKAAKQRAFLVIADTGRADPGIQVFVQRVMAGHLVALATLFMKPEPGAAALLKVTLYPQGSRRTHASKAVSHQSNQCAVTNAYEFTRLDRVQQVPHLIHR